MRIYTRPHRLPLVCELWHGTASVLLTREGPYASMYIVFVLLIAAYTTVVGYVVLVIAEMLYAKYATHRTPAARSAFTASFFEMIRSIERGTVRTELNKAVVPKSVAFACRYIPQLRIAIINTSGRHGEPLIWEDIVRCTQHYLNGRRSNGPVGTIVWIGAGYGGHLLPAASTMIIVDTPEIMRVRASVVVEGERPIHSPYAYTGIGPMPEGGMGAHLPGDIPATRDPVIFVGGFSTCGVATREDFVATVRCMRDVAKRDHVRGTLVLPFTHKIPKAQSIRLFTFAALTDNNVYNEKVSMATARDLLKDDGVTLELATMEEMDMLIIEYTPPHAHQLSDVNGKGDPLRIDEPDVGTPA